jgi:hypothetical protein
METMTYVAFNTGDSSVGAIRVDDVIASTKEAIIMSASLSSHEYFNKRKNLNLDTYMTFMNMKMLTGLSHLIDKILQIFINWQWCAKLMHRWNILPKNNKPKWCNGVFGYFNSNCSHGHKSIMSMIGLMMLSTNEGVLEIDYVDYIGRREWIKVSLRWLPMFKHGKYSTTKQWILDVYCFQRDDRRTLSMSGILGWRKPLYDIPQSE